MEEAIRGRQELRDPSHTSTHSDTLIVLEIYAYMLTGCYMLHYSLELPPINAIPGPSQQSTFLQVPFFCVVPQSMQSYRLCRPTDPPVPQSRGSAKVDAGRCRMVAVYQS